MAVIDHLLTFPLILTLEHAMSSTSLGLLLNSFGSISLVDFEFRSLNGNLPEPVCMVVKDYRTAP